MSHDPIVDEIRQLREARAKQFGYDVSALVKDAQQRDAADNRPIVRLSPRRVETEAARSSIDGDD